MIKRLNNFLLRKTYFYKLRFSLCASIFCCLLIAFPQKTNAQDYCTTPDVSTNANLNAAFQSMNATGPFYLKVYFHVIRRSNGTGGQSIADVQGALSILNQDFGPHNVHFMWDCQMNYINSDYWFAGPGNNSTGIFNVNNHYDGIDIYLFPSVSNSNGGRANGVGSSSEFWVAGNWAGVPVSQTSIISHEMGHVLFLWHTHHGCESGNWEQTNGNNCAVAGDYVCDTPADPHLGFNVNTSNCQWNGIPACSPPEPSFLYNPDEQVIMAYTPPSCMSYFTNGQGTRVRNAIASLPYLQATLTNNTSNSCGCAFNLNVNTNFNNGTLADFEVSNAITSTSNVYSGANVTFDAGYEVILEPNFDAVAGSDFHAVIDGCGGAYKTQTELKEEEELFTKVDLKVYPNPFQTTCNIDYQIPKSGFISIVVYDQLGQEKLRLIDNEFHNQGGHHQVFDGSNLPNGVYILSIQTDDEMVSQKMILSR